MTAIDIDVKKQKSKSFKKLPNRFDLLHNLEYDPATGLLIKKSTGKEVGYVDASGYRRFSFKGSIYCVHRIVYFMYHGKDPRSKVVDHCNGNRSDNRIENLRCVTHRCNKLKVQAARDKDGIPVELFCNVDHAKAFKAAVVRSMY